MALVSALLFLVSEMSTTAFVSCPHCGTSIDNDPNLAGLTVSCPACSGTFVMPSPIALGTTLLDTRSPETRLRQRRKRVSTTVIVAATVTVCAVLTVVVAISLNGSPTPERTEDRSRAATQPKRDARPMVAKRNRDKNETSTAQDSDSATSKTPDKPDIKFPITWDEVTAAFGDDPKVVRSWKSGNLRRIKSKRLNHPTASFEFEAREHEYGFDVVAGGFRDGEDWIPMFVSRPTFTPAERKGILAAVADYQSQTSEKRNREPFPPVSVGRFTIRCFPESFKTAIAFRPLGYDFVARGAMTAISDAAILFLKARQAYESGDFNEAVALLESATEQDQEMAKALDLLGRVYQRLGRTEAAQRSLANSKRLDPSIRNEAGLVWKFSLPTFAAKFNNIAISHSGEVLAGLLEGSDANEGRLVVWSLQSGKLLCNVKVARPEFRTPLAFLESDRRVLVGRRPAQAWDVVEKRKLAEYWFGFTNGEILCVAKGKASPCSIVDLTQSPVARQKLPFISQVAVVGVSSNNSHLVAASESRTFVVDIKSPRLIREFPFGAWSVYISNDGRTAVLDSRQSRKVEVWDVAKGVQQIAHQGSLLGAAKDGKLLLVRKKLDDPRLINTETEKTFAFANAVVAEFTLDGRRVVTSDAPSGGGSVSVRVWDAQTTREIFRFDVASRRLVWKIASAPDNRRFAAMCDAEVTVGDVRDRSPRT